MNKQFMNTKETAEFLCISPRTLDRFRVQGGGPVYRKFGGRVVYAIEDILKWADSRKRRNTADQG